MIAITPPLPIENGGAACTVPLAQRARRQLLCCRRHARTALACDPVQKRHSIRPAVPFRRNCA